MQDPSDHLELSLRLVAWNCCAGPLDAKLAALSATRPDLAVVPECPLVPTSPNACWVGANPRKGLGVFAKAPWSLRPVAVDFRLPAYVLPLQVDGPESFLLWAVWAKNEGGDRYVRGMHRAVDASTGLIRSQPNVMLGDFNSNAIWDREHPADRSHSALVDKLDRLGLVSAYHLDRRQSQGRETQPTFFEYRHKHRPYHIDYCFLPRGWGHRVRRVRVGRHARWSRWSDHMPVTIELHPAAETVSVR